MLRAVAFAVGLMVAVTGCTSTMKDDAIACSMALAATGQTDPALLWAAAMVSPPCLALRQDILAAVIDNLRRK